MKKIIIAILAMVLAPTLSYAGSKIFIIADNDIAKFNLNSSINLSASKSCLLLSSKISLVFKFLP